MDPCLEGTGWKVALETLKFTKGDAGLKGLSYEIDFENVDENWQILALTRAAVGF